MWMQMFSVRLTAALLRHYLDGSGWRTVGRGVGVVLVVDCNRGDDGDQNPNGH